jgi:hypothetical protein
VGYLDRIAVRRMELTKLETLPDLPEMIELHPPAGAGLGPARQRRPAAGAVRHA